MGDMRDPVDLRHGVPARHSPVARQQEMRDPVDRQQESWYF